MSNKYINIDFVESNKECNACDYHNDYTCFDCENEQVKTVYPNAGVTVNNSNNSRPRFSLTPSLVQRFFLAFELIPVELALSR